MDAARRKEWPPHTSTVAAVYDRRYFIDSGKTRAHRAPLQFGSNAFFDTFSSGRKRRQGVWDGRGIDSRGGNSRYLLFAPAWRRGLAAHRGETASFEAACGHAGRYGAEASPGRF